MTDESPSGGALSEDSIERRLHALADAIPALVSVVDLDYTYRYVNRAYSQWFDTPQDQIVGRQMWEIIGEASFAIVRSRLDAAFAGRTVTYDASLPYERGGTRHVLATYTPDRDPAGAVQGAFVIVHDVTERVNAEQATRETAAEFKAFLALPGAGKAQTDPETGRLLLVNERFCRITGYTEAELLGTPIADLTHPEDRERDQAAFAPFARGETSEYEIEQRYLRKDGTTVWVRVNAALIRDEAGRPKKTMATIRDISVEREALDALRAKEEALRRSEERFRLAADAVNGIIYDVDYQRGVVERTRGLYEVLGYRPEAVPIDTTWWVDQIHPEDRGRVEAESRLLFASQAREIVLEYRLRHKDGHYVSLLDRSIVSRDESGRVVRQVGCSQDVTQMRRAEAALREADRRKDEFLATLAHELRSPLAPIRTGVSLLKARGLTDPEDARVVGIIDRQVTQMARLLDDLLDVSRITRNRLELRRDHVELWTVVQAAAETSRPLIETGGHEFTLSLPPEPVWLHADPIRLAQVFANLLNNACKYTDRGGRISLAARHHAGHVEVTVRDTGIGMSPALLERAFGMFTQAEDALERSQGGLGIGLALVKGLVELHGGVVEAASDGPGRGSQFTVRLPTAPEPSTEGPDDRGSGAATAAPPLRVLVADDSTDAREMLEMLLRLKGYDVRTAADGEQAVEVAKDYRPHAIVLDIGMPRVNGYEAAQRIRALPWASHPVLIAATGWGQVEDKARATACGFDHHLTKPVDLDALCRLLAGISTRTS